MTGITTIETYTRDLGRVDDKGRRLGRSNSVVHVNPAAYGSDEPEYYSCTWHRTRDGKTFGAGGSRRFYGPKALQEATALATGQLKAHLTKAELAGTPV